MSLYLPTPVIEGRYRKIKWPSLDTWKSDDELVRGEKDKNITLINVQTEKIGN